MVTSTGRLWAVAASSNGTVFQLTPAGVLTTVYNFTYSGSDGAQPKGTLVQGADRRLYGTTQAGGLNGLGTVFALDLSVPTPTPTPRPSPTPRARPTPRPRPTPHLRPTP